MTKRCAWEGSRPSASLLSSPPQHDSTPDNAALRVRSLNSQSPPFQTVSSLACHHHRHLERAQQRRAVARGARSSGVCDQPLRGGARRARGLERDARDKVLEVERRVRPALARPTATRDAEGGWKPGEEEGTRSSRARRCGFERPRASFNSIRRLSTASRAARWHLSSPSSRSDRRGEERVTGGVRPQPSWLHSLRDGARLSHD